MLIWWAKKIIKNNNNVCVCVYIYIYYMNFDYYINSNNIYIFTIIIIIINFENSCATSYFCEYHDTFLGSIKKESKEQH